MLCDDPLDRAFRSLGYNTVRYPSVVYAPLLVLESDRHREVRAVGSLPVELPSSEPVPQIMTGQAAPDIGVTSTRRLSGKVGAQVVQPILSALGVGGGVSAALERGSGMTINLTGVSRDAISSGDLAAYLEGEIVPRSRHVAETAAAGRLFVVTGVLRSATLAVVVDANVAAQLQASLQVPQMVDVKVTPGREEASSRTMSFHGGTPLSFAFQAVRLLYADGVFMDYRTANGLAGFELPQQPSGGIADDGLLRLDESLVKLDA
jgi:hypothetical protein